jgi:hypothetical protein
VVKADGVVKDAEYLAQLHITAAQEASMGEVDRFLGCLMDGTSANRKCLKLIEAEMPRSVCIICQAHR